MTQPVSHATNPFALDASEFPRIVVVFPADFEDEDYAAIFDWYETLNLRAAREEVQLSYLVDTSAINPLFLGPARRRMATEHFQKHRESLERYTLCEARVVGTSIARGIVTAFDWIASQPWPTANFGTRAEAEAWLVEIEKRRGR